MNNLATQTPRKASSKGYVRKNEGTAEASARQGHNLTPNGNDWPSDSVEDQSKGVITIVITIKKRENMELLIFLFKSGLPTEEGKAIVEQRADLFRQVKGLLQKYYVTDSSTGQAGGVYVFDSKENLELFRDSDLAKSTGKAYKFTEPPSVRLLHIFKVLHDGQIATEQALSAAA